VASVVTFIVVVGCVACVVTCCVVVVVCSVFCVTSAIVVVVFAGLSLVRLLYRITTTVVRIISNTRMDSICLVFISEKY